jgi:hypothetical protein
VDKIHRLVDKIHRLVDKKTHFIFLPFFIIETIYGFK